MKMENEKIEKLKPLKKKTVVTFNFYFLAFHSVVSIFNSHLSKS
ncbi:MAG: hypothetical protein K0S23_3635 [Fluviicola sp.]|jgi:hypothetical protein|nr:hypothetical protein [Fluviicola sp.]